MSNIITKEPSKNQGDKPLLFVGGSWDGCKEGVPGYLRKVSLLPRDRDPLIPESMYGDDKDSLFKKEVYVRQAWQLKKGDPKTNCQVFVIETLDNAQGRKEVLKRLLES